MAFLRQRHPVSDGDLSAFVDGGLGASARDRVDAHLASCAACREALAGLRAVRQALVTLPREQAPRSFAVSEADARPAARPSAQMWGRAPMALGGLAAAAFLAFGVLIGIDVTGGSSTVRQQDGATMSFEAYRGDSGVTEAPPVPDASGALPDEQTPVPATLPEDTFDAADDGAASSLGATERDDRTGLRAAEGALAAVALVAGASLLLLWRRRA